MKPSNRPYFEIANPEIPNILAALPRELDVLDVGCGSGVHGAELDRIHGHRVVGVDLSETSIQKAKTRLVEAYVADVTKPENYEFFGRRKFDVIVFSDILEHLYDPFDVLTRHYQLLAPGGHVLISLPTSPSGTSGWSCWPADLNTRTPEHSTGRTSASLRAGPSINSRARPGSISTEAGLAPAFSAPSCL